LGKYSNIFFLDEFGVVLGKDWFGKVEKAIEIKTGKEVAIRSVDIKSDEIRNVTKEVEQIMKELKGKSPYLIDLIDSFEEVCKYIYIHYFNFLLFILSYFMLCCITLHDIMLGQYSIFCNGIM
jgi:hypothetical protein